MEEDIKEAVMQENNKQRQMNMMKEIRVRDYVRKSDFFQNLFNLPVPISIEYIVERYALMDTNNETHEISEEILNGIHKSIVEDITNDMNGLVLYENGTVDAEASEKQAEEIREEEKRNGFHVEDEKEENKTVWITEEIKKYVDYTENGKEDEELEKLYPRTSSGTGGSARVVNPDDFEKGTEGEYSRKETEDKIKKYILAKRKSENAKERIEDEEDRIISDMIDINEEVVKAVKEKNMDDKMFSNMPIETQQAIKRSLWMEMETADNPKDVVKAVRVLVPECSNIVNVDAIKNYLKMQLPENDSARIMIEGKEYQGLDYIDIVDGSKVMFDIEDVLKTAEIRNSNGTINPENFKKHHKEDYVNAGLTEYKKNIIERVIFTSPEKFEDRNAPLLIGAYKEYLKKEVVFLNGKGIINAEIDDTNVWKSIKPREDTVLQILQNIIKDNKEALKDYMDPQTLEIDFEKIKEGPDISSIKLSILETAMNNITKMRETYPSIKTDLYHKMMTIESAENKEEVIREVAEGLQEIPRELYVLDFHSERMFKNFKEEYAPELGEDLYREYERNVSKTQENKKAVVNARSEKVEKMWQYKLSKHPLKGQFKVGRRMTREEYEAKMAAKKQEKETAEKSKGESNENKAIIDKDISGVTSLNSVMAKPKMIVDEIEIPIDKESSAEKVASTFETLVNGQGLVAKFKSAGEDLTVEEYASKMGEIISDINEKIADGTIPKHINVDGSVKETTLPDVVSMSFNDVDISLEDLEQDISRMNKEEIGELIKNQIEEKAKDAQEKDVSQAEVGNEIQEKELDDEEKEVELEQEVVKEVIQDEGPTQEELKAILAQQQRASNEANVEQQVKEVVDKNDDLGLATNTSTQVVEEKKEEPAAPAKDTFFNKVKRGFFNNKVVKKFTELFGKKEENHMEDSVFASSSNNSKPVTKEEDHWGVIEDRNAAAKKALEEHEANKQKEAEKVKVGVVESKEDFEIGDE